MPKLLTAILLVLTLLLGFALCSCEAPEPEPTPAPALTKQDLREIKTAELKAAKEKKEASHKEADERNRAIPSPSETLHMEYNSLLADFTQLSEGLHEPILPLMISINDHWEIGEDVIKRELFRYNKETGEVEETTHHHHVTINGPYHGSWMELYVSATIQFRRAPHEMGDFGAFEYIRDDLERHWYPSLSNVDHVGQLAHWMYQVTTKGVHLIKESAATRMRAEFRGLIVTALSMDVNATAKTVLTYDVWKITESGDVPNTALVNGERYCDALAWGAPNHNMACTGMSGFLVRRRLDGGMTLFNTFVYWAMQGSKLLGTPEVPNWACKADALMTQTEQEQLRTFYQKGLAKLCNASPEEETTEQ